MIYTEKNLPIAFDRRVVFWGFTVIGARGIEAKWWDFLNCFVHVKSIKETVGDALKLVIWRMAYFDVYGL